MRTILDTVSKKMDPTRDLLRAANKARDVRDYKTAAGLYKEYLASHPKNARIQIQCGHMHKEIGILDEAGKHYLAAAALTPDDADLQIQLGHYYKVTDRLDDALAAYRRATELDPQDEDAKAQLAAATRMRAAPDFANASPRTALLARARLRSEAGEFLRNAPADQFDAVAANIRDSRRFYLLDGIEQRFPDPSLGKDSVVACIALCLEADAKQAAFRIVDAVLGASPDLSVPLSLLWRCLDPGRAEASASVQAPLTVQLATLSVAANILARQRAIIDRLAPTP